MTQIVRPASDISAGGWTASGGGSLYAAVDEVVASDADFIASGSSPSADACEIKFGAAASTDGKTNGHVLRYHVESSGAGTLTVTLLCGSTTVATWTDDWTAGDKTHTLTSGEAALISDYSNLRVRFSATVGSVTPPAYVPPSWSAIPTFTFTQGIPASLSFASYFTEGTGGTSTITGANLPTGVTVNSALRTLVYDGLGAVGSSSTCTLTADDGYGSPADLYTVTLRDTAGTMGLVFKQADVPLGSYVGSDLTGFQAVVKNRWQDGSAKFAVASWSGSTASSGSPKTVTIKSTTISPAGSDLSLTTLRAIGLTGSVALGSYGTVSLATVISGSPFRTWFSGPQCSEWHWRSQVGTDATLVVWYHVRLYANGRVWVRVVVENGYLFTGPTNKTYRAVITLNGATRFDTATDRADATRGPLYPTFAAGVPSDAVDHFPRTRWTQDFWYDGGSVTYATHAIAYLKTTKLWPNWGYTPSSYALGPNGNDTTNPWWDAGTANPTPVTQVVPFSIGNLRTSFPAGGYGVQIGIVPYWDCVYVTTGSESALRCVVANAVAGNSTGSSDGLVARDDATNLPVIWSSKPDLWYGGTTYTIATASGNKSPWTQDRAHHGSFGYTAYLLTGDAFHLETLQFWAQYCWVQPTPVDRENASALYYRFCQVREAAWSLRTFGQAACITPDGDSLRNQYRNAVYQNAQRYLDVYVDGTSGNPWGMKNTLGAILTMWASSVYWSTTEYYVEAPWQQHFMGSVLSSLQDYDIMDTLDGRNKLSRITQFSLGHAVGMLGDSSGFPFVLGGCYDNFYLKPGGTPPSTYGNAWASSWAQVYTWWKEWHTNPPAPPAGDFGRHESASIPTTSGSPMYESVEGGINGYVGNPIWGMGTWGNLMPAIAAAVDKGVPGASAAYARMTGASNWAAHAAYFPDRPGWGMVPR